MSVGLACQAHVGPSARTSAQIRNVGLCTSSQYHRLHVSCGQLTEHTHGKDGSVDIALCG